MRLARAGLFLPFSYKVVRIIKKTGIMGIKHLKCIIGLLAFMAGFPLIANSQHVSGFDVDSGFLSDEVKEHTFDSLLKHEVLPRIEGLKNQALRSDDSPMPIYRPDTSGKFYLRHKRPDSSRHFYLRKSKPLSPRH